MRKQNIQEYKFGDAVQNLFKHKIDFVLGKKTFQFINISYDEREDGRGFNTLVTAYDYKLRKYVVFNMDEETSNKVVLV